MGGEHLPRFRWEQEREGDVKHSGIPAYPGAKAVKFIPSSTGKLNGQSFKGLPEITLLTEDPPDKVEAWYRSKLSGWQEGEFLMTTYFWQGGDFHPLQISGLENPSVGVGEVAKALQYSAMPEAKTLIQVRYRPRG